MHVNISPADTAQHALEQYFDTGSFAQVNDIDGLRNVAEVVLERLPNGDYAWLRPDPEKVVDSDPAEPDDALYVPTQSGRDLVARWRAQEAQFGPARLSPRLADGQAACLRD